MTGNPGLPAEALRVVAEYMADTERLRAAAAAVLAEADRAPQVRLGDAGRVDGGVELRPVVAWPVLEALRKALG